MVERWIVALSCMGLLAVGLPTHASAQQRDSADREAKPAKRKAEPPKRKTKKKKKGRVPRRRVRRTAAQSNKKEGFQLTLGGGFKGGLGFKFARSIPGSSVPDENFSNPKVFTSSGFNGTGGPTLEIGVLNLFSVETGLFIASGSSTGTNTQKIENKPAWDMEMKQKTTTIHVPLLLKVSGTGGLIQPSFGLGYEFVIPQENSLEYEASNVTDVGQDPPDDGPSATELQDSLNERIAAGKTNYQLLMVTAGANFDMGNFKVPVEFRFGYNLNFEEGFESRTSDYNPDDQSFTYDGNYELHAGFYTGLLYEFDLYL